MKKTILVSWDVSRPDLIVPFSYLKKYFNLVFMVESGVNVDSAYHEFEIVNYNEIYFPNLILQKDPCFCIFMSIVSFYDISTNYYLKRNGVPTAILQHGYYAGDIDEELRYLRLKIKSDSRKFGVAQKSDIVKKLVFFSLSMGIKDLVKGWIFYLNQKKYGFWNYCLTKYVKFRKPSYLLAISYSNSRIHYKKDYVKPEDVVLLGNFMVPSKGGLEGKDLTEFKKKGGVLIFDSPYAERSIFGDFNSYSRFLRKLKECLGSVNVIFKLHPINYEKCSLFQELLSGWNVLKDFNWIDVVSEMDLIMSFQSSVIIPSKVLNKNVFLLTNDVEELSSFEKKLIGSSAIDFFEAKKIEIKEVSQFFSQEKKEISESFEELFLYKNDGQALVRLKEFLKNNCA